MYKIGELSKLCKLPVKTLRYYDQEGLLPPDTVDRFTGYRYYSAAKLADCNRIVALKELGFSLDEIRRHLKAASTQEVLTLIDAKQQELTESLAQIEQQLSRLNAAKKHIEEGEKSMFDLVIRRSDSIRVALVRKIFSTKEEAYRETERIKKALPKPIVGKRTLIINYETEYRESDFDLAACVEISGHLSENSGFEERQILFSGEVADLVCSSKELEEVDSFLTKQCNEVPAQVVGPFYEFFHEDGTVEFKVPVCRLSQTSDQNQDDAMNFVFENDPEAVGAWEFVDLLPSREQFSPYNRKYSDRDNFWLKKLYFLPGGADYWIVRGWTKGALYTACNYPATLYQNSYTIETINGQKLMFLAMKHHDVISRGGQPVVYVYRQVDQKEYQKSELRIRDNVDYPFIEDHRVVGQWTACDFGCSIGDFDPARPYWKGELFFQSVEFLPDGKAVALYQGKKPINLEWTKGILLDKHVELAEFYEFKTIDGHDYLFIEWKSGDYTFGGQAPKYYVFKRE